MEAKDLRAIIEQVLQEMNVSPSDLKAAESAPAAPAAAPAAAGTGLQIPKKGVALEPSVIEDGCLEDITEIDIRTQYLVEDPANKEAYAEQKFAAPCRLGIGKAGARYKTLPQLEFRAAHSAAQDAVFNDVDEEFVNYVRDEKVVAFPWTMIDKITPRPSVVKLMNLMQESPERMFRNIFSN